MTVLLTQQERVEGQHGSHVRGGLGNDQGDQINVEAGQSVERSGHYSPHGVTNQHHTLRGGLQMLAGREEKGLYTYWRARAQLKTLLPLLLF